MAQTVGHDDDNDTSYVEKLEFRFGYASRKPDSKKEYERTVCLSQTNVCSDLGAAYYTFHGGDVITVDRGLDSHMFAFKWIDRWVDLSDKRFCFHANFTANVWSLSEEQNEGDAKLFFVEVIGVDKPDYVTQCLDISKWNERSVKNCRFCTGLWHPVAGGFNGEKELGVEQGKLTMGGTSAKEDGK
uniref:DUF3615 domain-containing protein n=1 Tax=Oryza meridionalis TaxID=40149 RepID=A0A0E0DUD0_9ORYZ